MMNEVINVAGQWLVNTPATEGPRRVETPAGMKKPDKRHGFNINNKTIAMKFLPSPGFNTLFYILLMVGLGYNVPLSAQQETGFTPEKAARIDSLLSVLADNNMFQGGVLVAINDKRVYTRYAGYANRSRNILHSDTTTFNLASLSKPFTAVAVLQLVQNKKLSLTDHFIKYFPDFPYPEVTIRQLLNHTSGIPQLENSEAEYVKQHPDELITNAKAYADLVAQKSALLSAPGNRWRYNNGNYVLLALLVEKVSGLSFDVYMKKNVFQRAGMQRTYVRNTYAPNTMRYMMPAMYMTDYRDVDSLDHNKYYTYYNLGGVYGPNNVVSTLNDLLLFDNALEQGKLLGKALLDSAFTPVVLNNGKTFYMGNSTRSYGLGWSIYTSRSSPVDTFVFHDGHIMGLTTILHKNLTKGQTIIIYDNIEVSPFVKMSAINNILNDQPIGNIRVARSVAREYGKALIEKGPDYALGRLQELRTDSANYYLDELEMNTLGYDLLFKDPVPEHVALSVETFKVNTLLYPKSANAYDSYAEALLKAGKKEEAILMYKRSLFLNPNNETAKKVLAGQ
ncbi:MAG: serine hydrolase [Chitinophagaceae bacterium]